MKKSLLILSLTLLFVGCDMSSSGVAEAERELEERAIQEEIDDYRRTLPITDLNHPEYVLPQDPGFTGRSGVFGIDENSNGIRDDVEIYIYNKYKDTKTYKRTLIAVASQYARSTQKILVDPENAYTNETYKIQENVTDCLAYFERKHAKINNLKFTESVQFSIKNNPILDSKLKDKIYNTKERIREKFKYEEALGGKIYPDHPDVLEKCETNLDKLGEF